MRRSGSCRRSHSCAAIVSRSSAGRRAAAPSCSPSTIRASDGRKALRTISPPRLPFYPGSCSEKWQSQPYTRVAAHGWASRVPLLVLFGEDDVWTELKPCEAFLSDAKERGSAIELKTYAHAVHGFDAPNTARRELPEYTEPDGRIPVIGTDKAAREDAFMRVPAYLAEKLGK